MTGVKETKFQIFVKVYIFYTKLVLLVLFSMFIHPLFSNTVDNCCHKTTTNTQIIQNIGAGVNLSLLEHTWEPAEELLKTDEFELSAKNFAKLFSVSDENAYRSEERRVGKEC